MIPDPFSRPNLSVDQDHTFFVASKVNDEAVWVHNTDPTQPPTTRPVGNPNAPVKTTTQPSDPPKSFFDKWAESEMAQEERQKESDALLLQGLVNTVQAGVHAGVTVLGFIWDMTLGNPGYDSPRPPAVLEREQAESQKLRQKLTFAKDLIVHQPDQEYDLNMAIGEFGWGLVSLKLPFKSPEPRVGPTIAARALQGEAAGLLKSAVEANRAGVSAAGRALQKHAARPGSWLNGLTSGNNAENTATARKLLDEILAKGTVTRSTHPVHGEVIKVRLADGRGAWWHSTGELIGFLEAYTPR